MKQKQAFSIKDVVAIGVGAALFVVIAMIPIPAPAPNTSIQLQYALQALFSVVFGPIVGFLMGLIGHAIKDAMSGGLWWTWIISSGLFGLFVGFFRKQIGELKGEVTKKELIVFNVVQVIANFAYLGIDCSDWGCDDLQRKCQQSLPSGCCSRFCQCFSCSYCRFSSLDCLCSYPNKRRKFV